MFDHVIKLDDAISSGTLHPIETFPAPGATSDGQKALIRIVFPEFTCVCPRTGYPDFGTIELYYLPNAHCIELKSWKLFLNSFRMVGTFHETATGFIYDTVLSQLHPQWAMVIGDFFPRGNVDTTIVFETPSPRPRGSDVVLGNHAPFCRSFHDR